ncbi:MAG: DUF4294 domain-containing protein [Bacteroidales bacterium]|jgi:hypothetical protein|nr:DUF4294 domain-containing protein [Bacteroidales bacterium]
MKRVLLTLLALLCLGFPSEAQNSAQNTEPEVEYWDYIAPSSVTGRRKRTRKERKEWRRHYRLVYNFNRVYPYALVGRKLMNQVDSTIAAEHLDKGVRARYINDVEKELLRLFEKDIRNTTITQGFLLVRLVDRECGHTVYDIIKDYEGGFAAGFWNLVGKLFDQDLKSHYDPEGVDKDTEELIRIWESGAWDEFYWEIFGKYPDKTEIVTDRLSTSAHRK